MGNLIFFLLPWLVRAKSSGNSIVFINGNLKVKSSGGLNSYSSYFLLIEDRALDACKAPIKGQDGRYEKLTV